MNTKHFLILHLWYDNQAADFYCLVFPDSEIISRDIIHDTGDCDYLSFGLLKQRFEAISANPHYRSNPSIPFTVNFDPYYEDSGRTARMRYGTGGM